MNRKDKLNRKKTIVNCKHHKQRISRLKDCLTLPGLLRPEADDDLGRRPRRWRYVCRFLLSSTSTGFTLWSSGSIALAAGLQRRNIQPHSLFFLLQAGFLTNYFLQTRYFSTKTPPTFKAKCTEYNPISKLLFVCNSGIWFKTNPTSLYDNIIHNIFPPTAFQNFDLLLVSQASSCCL